MVVASLRSRVTLQGRNQADLVQAIENLNSVLNALYPSANLSLQAGVLPVSTLAFAAGSALTVTAALHAGRTIQMDTLTGSICTLPAATGTGNVYEFVTTVVPTSNSHIVKVANGTDVIQGALLVTDDAAGTGTLFSTVATSDTITLNRTTTGGVRIGERIIIKDVKAGFFSVSGVVIATGAEATPFSATV